MVDICGNNIKDYYLRQKYDSRPKYSANKTAQVRIIT
jgi:hypothetical protein